jgi:hypothetical protein
MAPRHRRKVHRAYPVSAATQLLSMNGREPSITEIARAREHPNLGLSTARALYAQQLTWE